jgi:hypothetical protein
MQTYEELVDQRAFQLMQMQKARFGAPCAGSTSDIWSLASCRESFGCLRVSFVLDGDLIEQLTGNGEYSGKLVDMCPIIAFDKFVETRHTGAALARWKKAALLRWLLLEAIGLATEDGASNNKAANKILEQDQLVCYPHDMARAILTACGLGTSVSLNSGLKGLCERSGKQSAAFSRSVVANKQLQEAQLAENPNLKAHQTLTVKKKNATRWLGLWEMCNRNRILGPEIRIALTGDDAGICMEADALPAARPTGTAADNDDDDDSDGSDGDDIEEGNRLAGKQYTLSHRCLSALDYRHNDIFESLLDRPREVCTSSSTLQRH